MNRHLLALVAYALFTATLCIGYGCGDAGYGPSHQECGANSIGGAGSCACLPGYDPCDFSSAECCAWSATQFSVFVNSARITPFKPDSQQPWDWDGNVPDWLLQGVALLANFYPEAVVWSEVLTKVDEYAPELLEGTVPPDVYLVIEQESAPTEAYSSTQFNTYEPRWDEGLTGLHVAGGDILVRFYDEDLEFDDYIDGVRLDRESLRRHAGHGPTSYEFRTGLFEVTITVLAEDI